MKNLELSIPNMKSVHCQIRVHHAINYINGMKVQNLQAGKLSVSVESDDVGKKLVEAIEKAGYQVNL